jgi:hypothetical protein
MACFNSWDIGACGCIPATFNFTFNLYGCKNPPNNAAIFSGITVNVYDHFGGTLLVSGTTGAGGSVLLAVPGATGTHYVTVPAPNARWTNYGANLSLTSGGTGTIQLPTNTAGGYACCSNIDIPIHNQITYTDANGSHTYSWTSCSLQGYYSMAGVGPNFGGTPQCSGAAATRIYRIIQPNGANILATTREWYVSASTPSCYCDYAGLCGGNGQGKAVTANYTITSIAIPLAFTVTPTGDAGDPVGGNITISE